MTKHDKISEAYQEYDTIRIQAEEQKRIRIEEAERVYHLVADPARRAFEEESAKANTEYWSTRNKAWEKYKRIIDSAQDDLTVPS